MTEALLGFFGIALGSVLTFLGVRYTARQSAKAAEKAAATAAAVSERQVDVEEWRSIVTSLREEVERLGSRVKTLEDNRENDRALIESLRRDIEARDLRYRLLVRYTRRLLAWAREVVSDHSPPAVPPDLAADLAD